MRSSTRSLVLSLILLAGLSACSESSEPDAFSSEDGAQEMDAEVAEVRHRSAASPVPPSAPVPSAAAPGGVQQISGTTADQVASSAATYTDGQRQFIRTAQAQFRVDDVYRSALAIEDVVAAQGGFVVKNEIVTETQSTQRRPTGDGKLIELAEYTVRGRLSVRVPSANSQEFLRAIVEHMAFLDRRNFDAMDAQFQVLRQQLAYQRSQEAQADLGDAAQQDGRIDRRAAVIQARTSAKASRDEALVAQKEFEDRVAFSTIDLSLYQTPRIRQTELTDVEAVFRQNRAGFLARLGTSLRVGWDGALNAVIELGKLWPLWLLLLVGAVAYLRLRRKGATTP